MVRASHKKPESASRFPVLDSILTAAQAASRAGVSRQYMHNVINAGTFDSARRVGEYTYPVEVDGVETEKVHPGFVVIDAQEFDAWASKRVKEEVA